MENPQVVYTWKAPLRPHIKRSANVLRFYLAIALLVSLIILFLGDWILIIPIATLLFLFYVLTITPSPEVENKITQFGVETAGVTLRFDTLSHFYFSRRFDYEILTLVTHAPYFYHTYLVVPDEEVKRKIITYLSKHIVYQEKPKKTVVDKLTNWVSSLVAEDEERERIKSAAATSQEG